MEVTTYILDAVRLHRFRDCLLPKKKKSSNLFIRSQLCKFNQAFEPEVQENY